MKISKSRLKQIIREELQVTLTNEEAGEMFGEEIQLELEEQEGQLGESIDVQTVDNLELAYKEMMIPVKQAQVFADTGKPVSKDPEVMHKEAVDFIMHVVSDVTSPQSQASDRAQTTMNEDGHMDVPSAARKMKLAIEDAGQILAALEGGQGDLPSWWMSKVTVAADYLNKARDYLLVPSEEMSEQ